MEGNNKNIKKQGRSLAIRLAQSLSPYPNTGVNDVIAHGFVRFSCSFEYPRFPINKEQDPAIASY